MKLLILSGFLGSGKTTVLLKLARLLAKSSQKIAIIENEIGEVGVDGEYLNQEGLEVQELFGGCICCTLSLGLIQTLEKLEQSFSPDLVVMETTGAARPGDILENLRQWRKEAADARVMTIVDAGRFDLLMNMMEPLITAQIQAADMAVLNKIDQVDGQARDRIVGQLRQMQPSARVLALSAEAPEPLGGLLEILS